MNTKNVRFLNFEEHSSIYNFILISNLFSKFKSSKNYRFYLKWQGFAEVKPHRFNEINVIHIECVCPNLSQRWVIGIW